MAITMGLYIEITADLSGSAALYDNRYKAQTFTPGVTITFDGVKVWIENYGSNPGGDLLVSLCNTDGSDKPSSIIETKTIAPGSVNYGNWTEIDFSNVTLIGGTIYAIVLSSPDSVALTPYKIYGSTDAYGDGTGWNSSDSGSSWTDHGGDRPLRVYGEAAVPSDPINPTPADNASEITLDDTTLTWEDGGGAETYDVYFRPSGEFFEKIASDVVGTSVDAIIASTVAFNGHYSYGQLYLWCVIAKNEYGSNNDPPSDFGIGYGGVIWEFNALVFVPPTPSGITWDDPGNAAGYTGTPTGENAMLSAKRLVAAANNRIWYEGI